MRNGKRVYRRQQQAAGGGQPAFKAASRAQHIGAAHVCCLPEHHVTPPAPPPSPTTLPVRSSQRFAFKHNLYKLREERDIKPSAFGQLVSATLYERRFGPYFCQPVIGAPARRGRWHSGPAVLPKPPLPSCQTATNQLPLFTGPPHLPCPSCSRAGARRQPLPVRHGQHRCPGDGQGLHGGGHRNRLAAGHLREPVAARPGACAAARAVLRSAPLPAASACPAVQAGRRPLHDPPGGCMLLRIGDAWCGPRPCPGCRAPRSCLRP